jgi:hypothetical protein
MQLLHTAVAGRDKLFLRARKRWKAWNHQERCGLLTTDDEVLHKGQNKVPSSIYADREYYSLCSCSNYLLLNFRIKQFLSRLVLGVVVSSVFTMYLPITCWGFIVLHQPKQYTSHGGFRRHHRSPS